MTNGKRQALTEIVVENDVKHHQAVASEERAQARDGVTSTRQGDTQVSFAHGAIMVF